MRMSPTEEGIKGRVEVELVGAPTDVVWIHAGDNLTVTSAMFENNVARIERVSEDLVGLSFSLPLPHHPTLSITYEGKLPSKDGRGAYRQEEKGDWYIFTQFESTDARRAFPCFDEPGFKTPFTISLQVPEDQLAFANTPEVSSKRTEPGWKKVTFAPSQPLPTYLVAFAVGPFEVVDAGKHGKKQTPIRIIVPKGRSVDAKYAASTTGTILSKLEEYFDMPYPYEKLDHIAVPQKGGAMENPGLITYGNPIILSQGDVRSLKLERAYTSVAAHELGHIWFGDYVTTAWWDDIWLNEAFATWISAKIQNSLHPDWDTLVNRAESKNTVMLNDALVSARRIRQPIESRHDILNAFDGITYQKGGAVISMMEQWVGVEPFRKAVQGYLQRHAHGNATSQEFLSDMASQLDDKHAKDFTPTFSSFLDQPGFPVIDAKLTCAKDGGATLALTQQRYVPTGSTGAEPETWSVPVCASAIEVGKDGTPVETKTCTLLKDKTGELKLPTDACPAWVNPNAHAAGYYRGFIDDKNEAKLLADRKLTSQERVAAFGDELAFVHNGRLGDDKVLAQLGGLVQEGNRFLVGMSVDYVWSIDENLVSEALRPKLDKLVRATFLPKAKALGWTPKEKDDDGTRLLRPQVLALASAHDDTGLAAEARKLTDAWLADRKAIDRDLMAPVLAAGMRSGDKAHWDKLHDAAKKTNDRQERTALLDAMSRARDPKLAEESLKLALSDEFDRRESIALVYGVATNPANRQLAWDFVKQHYEALIAPLPWRAGASLINVAGHFCDAEHRKDAETFFADRAQKSPGGPRVVAQVLEGMSLCIAQRPAREKNVSAFLGKY
jgi:alanyl aminopeptidase